MTIERFRQAALATPGVVLREGCDEHKLRSEFARLGWTLPTPHVELLACSNGVTAFGGFFRILGVGEGLTTLETWNLRETWKFAWPRQVEEYLCFAEDAWGDQYAYRFDELSQPSPRVYWLESLSLEAEVWEPDFMTFLFDDFLRNAVEPWDMNMLHARRRFGDLPIEQHLVYSPSPLLCGETDPESIMLMSAHSAMIANGDLAREIGDATFEREVSHLEPFEDERGRMRLRVVWT